jgi:hypothetical protein
MKNKTKNKLKWLPSIFIAFVIMGSAVSKLAHVPALVETFSKIGLLPYIELLAIAELLLIGLFLWPRTMKAAFLLLTGYYGGAMAVEFSHGYVFIFPAFILIVIWIAAYLRDPSLFETGQLKQVGQSDQNGEKYGLSFEKPQ